LDMIEITEELGLSLPLLTESTDRVETGYNNSFLSKHNETSMWVAYSDNVTEVSWHLTTAAGNTTFHLSDLNAGSSFGVVAVAFPAAVAESAFSVS